MDESNQPHIMDFGLAKREIGEISMTMDGQVLGTPAYMSPEQAGGRGHWTDRRTDIYSLGVVMFRMLTGELPFRGNAQMQIHQRQTVDPPDPRTLNRFLPRDLCTICLKCMERDPNRRFATAKELADELSRFDRGEPILSRPISRTERVLRWTKRNPTLTTAALLTVFLAIAGPITAMVIFAQRNELDKRYKERGNLIQTYAAEKEADANRISELRAALDIWEGRANPWELWPPKPSEAPRKMLLQEVAGQAGSLATPAPQAADQERQAFANLALAVMHDELGRTAEAIDRYEAAIDLLTRLSAQSPASTHYAAALADCYRQLSRLRKTKDPEAAALDLEKGRTIAQRLATEHADPRLQAEWLEAELDSAIVSSPQTRSPNLDRVQQIKETFPQKVPKDPVEQYQLACFLAGREPILITRQPHENKENK
jgi:hypothetical protein